MKNIVLLIFAAFLFLLQAYAYGQNAYEERKAIENWQTNTLQVTYEKQALEDSEASVRAAKRYAVAMADARLMIKVGYLKLDNNRRVSDLGDEELNAIKNEYITPHKTYKVDFKDNIYKVTVTADISYLKKYLEDKGLLYN